VMAEVLSKSTQDYDRGSKFEHYRTLESLQEYILVAQEKYHVVHYVRQPNNTWVLSETEHLEDRLHLSSISCDLPLTEVYAKVQIDAAG
jgi:Uma2 family endonuclease